MVEFDSASAANILHLSDLHFGADIQSDPAADAEKWYGQLVDDLCKELKCERLDAVIISGDVGNFSEPGEYMAAHIFIDLLCEKFGVGKNCLVIVPGNHDLNRKDSNNGYREIDKEKNHEPLKVGYFIEKENKVILLRDEDAYPNRFNHFSRFYKNFSEPPIPLILESRLPFITYPN